MTHPNTDHRKQSNPAHSTHPPRTLPVRLALPCLLHQVATPSAQSHFPPCPSQVFLPVLLPKLQLSQPQKGSLCNWFNQRGGGFRPTSTRNKNASGNLSHCSLCQGPGVSLEFLPNKQEGFEEIPLQGSRLSTLGPCEQPRVGDPANTLSSPPWAQLARSPRAGPSAPLLPVGAGAGFASTRQQRGLAASTPRERPSLPVWSLSYSQRSQK